jgi:hypothetical protein
LQGDFFLKKKRGLGNSPLRTQAAPWESKANSMESPLHVPLVYIGDLLGE